jgi:hypothetical protein
MTIRIGKGIPGGVAGGSLEGSYPNPTLSTATKRLFVQLVSALTGAEHKENFGTLEMALESETEVTHGLGSEPLEIHLTAQLNENVSPVVYVKTKGPTKFTIRNNTTKKVGVMWRALT